MDKAIPAWALAAAVSAAPAALHAEPQFLHTGRDLAASCAICHGTNGVNAGGIADLAARPREHLVQQLRDFRDGRREATIMHQIARGLTDAQIEAVSEYWAKRTPR